MADEKKTEEKKKKTIGVTFKVSAKGAVSAYGLGRFPVTLYREQWVRLLERSDDLKKFLEENAESLKAKGDASPVATPVAPEGEPILGAAGSAEPVEQATTSEDAGAPRVLEPGSEQVADEPEVSYHDDYSGETKPAQPWRPGNAPGVDGPTEEEQSGEVDRDDVV